MFSDSSTPDSTTSTLLLEDNYDDIRDYNPLFLAIHKGELNLVHSLLEENSVEEKIHKRTLMHVAAERGHEEIVSLLFQSNYGIDEQDRIGNTPLHLAVKRNHSVVVNLLLNKNTVNLRNSFKETSLHIAAAKGHAQIVELLLKNGAKVNKQDAEGKTPLHNAVQVGNRNIDVIRILIRNEASIDLVNKRGTSPLSLAVKKSKTEVVRHLLHRKYNWKMMTSLHDAAKCGNLEIVKLLMINGYGTVEDKNETCQTALYFATLNSHLEVVKYLIQNGSNIKSATNGESLLHLCIKNNRVVVLKHLIECGASINETSSSGETLLHYSAFLGRMKISKYLIKSGAKIDAKTCSNETPLHFAIRAGHVKVVKELLNQRAKTVESDSSIGKLAVYLAVENENEEILKVLLKAGCSVEGYFEGRTPLHVAVTFDNTKLVKILVNAGADIHSETEWSETPLHLAAAAGRPSVVKYLLEIGANPKAKCKDDVTNIPLTPLHYALNRGRNGGNWCLSSLMFENYFKITEMLLIKGPHPFTGFDLVWLLKFACEIRIVEDELVDSMKQVKFSPVIVKCILNYTPGNEIASRLFLVINFAVKFKIPRIIDVLLEYDVQQSYTYYGFHFSQIHPKTLISLIDHIKNDVTVYLFVRVCHNSENIYGVLDKNVLKMLVAHIVFIRSAPQKCKELPYQEKEDFKKADLVDWYLECEIQIKNMRETKIHHEYNVTYYDVLSKPVSKLANYIKCQNFLEMLECSYMKFPAYAEFLERHVQMGKERRDLIDSSAQILVNAIKRENNIQLPSLVLQEIFEYLSAIHMRKVLSAGRL